MQLLYVALEACKILAILLTGFVVNVVMLVKAAPGEPVEGFILSILFLTLAFCFWYVADVCNFVLQKNNVNLIFMVFVWLALGYVTLIGGLAEYFTASMIWISPFIAVAVGISWRIVANMTKGLTEGIDSNGS